MKRHLVAALAVAAAIAFLVPSTASATGRVHRAATAVKNVMTGERGNAAFMREAALGGMAEVELGRIGVQRAESPDVKQFAQRMIDDHSKANDELKELAQKENVTLPTQIDAKHKATMTRLSKLSGAEFDRAYMHDMVNDHVHDVAAFERQAKETKDSDLKAWIERTLPTLKDHQQMAQETATKVGAGTMHGKAGGQATGTARAQSRHRKYQGEATR